MGLADKIWFWVSSLETKFDGPSLLYYNIRKLVRGDSNFERVAIGFYRPKRIKC